jgi:hypothetical protein
MTYATSILLVLSLAGFAAHEPRPAAPTTTTDCREVAQPSGRFHLSDSEQPTGLTFRGEAGALTIHKAAPLAFASRTAENDIALGA